MDPEPTKEPLDATLPWIDLALGQGLPRELETLRERVAADTQAALQFAELRNLLERAHDLRCEPSGGFAERMESLCRLARKRRPRPERVLPLGWQWAAAAATLLFILLAAADPLGLRSAGKASVTPVQAVLALEESTQDPEPQPDLRTPPVPLSTTLANAIEATQRLAPDSLLTDAWERFQERPETQGMAAWVAPRNAVSYLLLERELRESSEERIAALFDRELAAAMRNRAARMTERLLHDVNRHAESSPRDLALVLRALVAGGSGFDPQIAGIAVRLSARLDEMEHGDLGMGLCALGEAAITSGRGDAQALELHGRRLVASVLGVDVEAWGKRRPRLLQTSESAPNLAAAGRFLRIAPTFGVDPAEAKAVRMLLLAHLEERLTLRIETPDVPTAIAYGFHDLISPAVYENVERSLRRWRPEALAPDYLALQQFAASRRPDQLGFARWQLEARRVATLPEPDSLADRAALALCLWDCILAGAPRVQLAGM